MYYFPSDWRLFLVASLLLLLACQAPADERLTAVRKQAIEWRHTLLNDGAAGLYQAIDLDALAKAARLPEEMHALLPRLGGLFAGPLPRRVRLYPHQQGDEQSIQWLARLDFAGQQLNFLILQQQQGRLSGWYDMGLGVSLATLLHAAAELALGNTERLESFLEQLADKPLEALAQVGPESPLARLVLAACAGKACYREALERISVREGEVSLFALEKAVTLKQFQLANPMMAKLQQQLSGDPTTVWLAATLAMTQGDCQQALQQLLPAIKRWPAEPRLYPLVSQCYMLQQQPRAALAMLQQMQQQTGIQVDWAALVKTPLYAPLSNYLSPSEEPSTRDK